MEKEGKREERGGREETYKATATLQQVMIATMHAHH